IKIYTLFLHDALPIYRNLARFANSQIIQNVSWEDFGISVRAVVGKKIGVASTNRMDAKGLEEITEKATAIAKLQQEDPEFVSLRSEEHTSELQSPDHL